jgi:putative tryptophan/tyrosine transport system substrate-binding protein
MKTLAALVFCIAAVFGGVLSTSAQERSRVPHIGYLALGSITPPGVFVQKMREKGYFDGQTVAFEYRFAEGRHERLLPLARELAERQVDILYAYGDEAIAAAQIATKTIPIVMFACDAVTTGFVESLARPGGNTTGVSCITTELSGKRVAVFHEMVPRLKRLAVLYNPENKSKPMDFALTRDAANSFGIDVDGFEAREPQDVDRIFAGFASGKPDGVSVLDEAFTMINARQIVELARRQGLPTMHSFREPVDAGGLVSYGPSQAEMTAIATTFIGRILKGVKPADLPVQQPTNFEMVINIKTARTLRLTVPPTLLARADEVIE